MITDYYIDDKELLERAAESIGLRGEYRTENIYLTGNWVNVTAIFREDGEGWWNPLVDDGDALRLAVHHRFEIAVCPGCTIVCDGEPADVYVEEKGEDLLINTRRGITRAAAMISYQRAGIV